MVRERERAGRGRERGEGESREREREGGGDCLGAWWGPERRNQVPLVEGLVGVPSLMKNSPVCFVIVWVRQNTDVSWGGRGVGEHEG